MSGVAHERLVLDLPVELALALGVERAGDDPLHIVGPAREDRGVVGTPESLHVPLDGLGVHAHGHRASISAAGGVGA